MKQKNQIDRSIDRHNENSFSISIYVIQLDSSRFFHCLFKEDKMKYIEIIHFSPSIRI